jgi:hypothetical protein
VLRRLEIAAGGRQAFHESGQQRPT